MEGLTNSTQVAVVGGGPGGYAAAFMAADLGLRVALVDLEPNPGGVCLYYGCIPSKALLHVARVIGESRQAADWGIEFSEPRVDLDKLRAWKDGVVNKLTGGLGQLSKQRKVDFIRGRAAFHDSRTLKIEGQDGERRLVFENAILATGSRPAAPGSRGRFAEDGCRDDSSRRIEVGDRSGDEDVRRRVAGKGCVAAAPDLIVDGMTGFTTPVGDEAALAWGLTEIREALGRGTDFAPACRRQVGRCSFAEATRGLVAAMTSPVTHVA